MESPIVLCVDDCLPVLLLRKASLEVQGYRVKIATSGWSALQMLAGMKVSGVLLEYKNEGIDAEAVALHIKQRFPDMPIILLSAYSDMPERILWLVDEYVTRGELPDQLMAIIQRATAPRPGDVAAA